MDPASNYYAVYPLPGIAEPLSALSHFFAAIVFAWLSLILIKRTIGSKSRLRSIKLYCCSIVTLLLVSGLYHLFPRDLVIRDLLQRLDHATIFVVIAATFTPIHIALFENAWRWGMLAVVWTLAVAGMILSIGFLKSVPESYCLGFYLGLGWLGLITGSALCRRFGFCFVIPLLLGALAYTVGAVGDFLNVPIIVTGIVGPHEVFHFAVIAGIGFHWKFISAFAHRSIERCGETGRIVLSDV